MKYVCPLGWLIVLLIFSCTTTKYIPVEVEKVREHHTTDTLQVHDTLTVEATTIIREVDSMALAAFGIQLDNQQRAWLIEKNNLQRQITNANRVTHDTIRDTITTPIYIDREVEKEVPAEITWYQQIAMKMGYFSLILIIAAIAYRIKKLL